MENVLNKEKSLLHRPELPSILDLENPKLSDLASKSQVHGYSLEDYQVRNEGPFH